MFCSSSFVGNLLKHREIQTRAQLGPYFLSRVVISYVGAFWYELDVLLGTILPTFMVNQ